MWSSDKVIVHERAFGNCHVLPRFAAWRSSMVNSIGTRIDPCGALLTFSQEKATSL